MTIMIPAFSPVWSRASDARVHRVSPGSAGSRPARPRRRRTGCSRRGCRPASGMTCTSRWSATAMRCAWPGGRAARRACCEASGSAPPGIP